MTTDNDNSQAIARAVKKVERSRQFILARECFFATVMLRLNVEMEEGGTMSTNGSTWKWGWRFVDEDCDQDKVNFVNLHERGHEALDHPTRVIPLTDKALANIAADHVVNIMIVRMGLTETYTDVKFRQLPRRYLDDYATYKHPSYKAPKDAVLDPRFAGMTLEEVYYILSREDEEEEKEGPGRTGDDGGPDGDDKAPGEGAPGEGPPGTSRKPCPWGDVEEAVNPETGEALTPEEIAEVRQELAQDLATAENIAKGRGQMPGVASENVKLAKGVSQNWEDILRDLMKDTIPVDFTFSRQNTHDAGSVLVTPGILKEGMGHLGVFADASGSVSQGEYAQGQTELWYICEELMPERVTFLQFDWTASDPEIIEQGDVPELVRKRSGGTRFSAPFKKCEELGILDDFDAIVIFTDGEDCDFPDEPNCPVIWCTTGPFYGGPPPFGEVVGMRFSKT